MATIDPAVLSRAPRIGATRVVQSGKMLMFVPDVIVERSLNGDGELGFVDPITAAAGAAAATDAVSKVGKVFGGLLGKKRRKKKKAPEVVTAGGVALTTATPEMVKAIETAAAAEKNKETPKPFWQSPLVLAGGALLAAKALRVF